MISSIRRRMIRCFKRMRSEEHTSELQSRFDLVCRLLLEKKNKLSVSRVNPDGVARNEAALEDLQGERIDQTLLDDTLERPGPVGQVIAHVRYQGPRSVSL